MDSFDDGNLSSLVHHVHTDAMYIDFDLDSFLNESIQEPCFSQRPTENFGDLDTRPSLLPTSSHPVPRPEHAPEIDLTQTKVRFSSTPRLSYDTSPFENSLLSFDNASACFSWASSAAPGFSVDTDEFMLDNASESCGIDAVATKIAPVKGAERRRRPNLRFPRSSVQVLESWLSRNSTCPYPTDRDKNELKKETGLKRSQISSWFANARKRGKVKPPSAPIDPAPEQPVLDLPGIENIHPFDRWRLAPLEFEAADVVDIAKAIVREARPCDPVEHYSRTKSTRSKSISCISNYLGKSTASELSMEIGSRPGIQSAADDQSQTSLAFSEAIVRRRRRRQTVVSSSRSVNASLSSKKFQCTFCRDSFRRKHDWQRHEKSQHLPLESWTCSPNGPTHVNPITNEITCVFCDLPDPTPEHIQTHSYSACIKRFSTERTFYRKDHLRQHLRLMHGNCAFIDSMKSWNCSSSAIRARCGFCDAKFETWTARVAHLAEHFAAGTSMREWRGDWGFEPHVLRILERATLPETWASDAGEDARERVDQVTVPVRAQPPESRKVIPLNGGNLGQPFTQTNPESDQWIANDSQPQADIYPFIEDFGLDGLHGFYSTHDTFSPLATSPNPNVFQHSTLNTNDAPEFNDLEQGTNTEHLQYHPERQGSWDLGGNW